MSDVAVQFPIEMTDAAAAKVKALITEEANPELKLRVYIPVAVVLVSSMALRLMRRSTTVIQWLKKDSVIMVVDGMSLQYLVAVLLIISMVWKACAFTVINLNATTTCGCGSSFSVYSH